MILEIGIGTALAVLGFLYWKGISLLPIVFVGGLFFLLSRVSDLKTVSSKKFITAKSGSKNGELSYLSFSQIGGQETAKKELLEALEFIRCPEIIATMGIRPLKGVMLLGPPGTGKTMLAKAAAGYTDSAFVAAAGSQFIEMYAGVGAQRVRKLFTDARSQAKKLKKKSAVIFVDEIEALGGKRGSHSSHMEYDQTLNQLLVEMDGIGVNDEIQVLVMGATNRPEALDKALMRPGRFDRVVQVDLPDLTGRLQILKLHTNNKPLDSSVDLERIAKETFGFSGAQLESLANEAAILAMRENVNFIEHKHLVEAVDKVMMGEISDRRPEPEELRRVAIHESGHALMSEITRPGSVSAITITPRGKALGYMRQMPEKDSYLYTREELDAQISIALAGSAAEELILGNRSTGAANDFEQALNIARKVVITGLSSLGIVGEQELPKSQLHKEMQTIINFSQNKVSETLARYQSVITKMAVHLLEKEKIDGAFLRDCIKEKQAAV